MIYVCRTKNEKQIEYGALTKRNESCLHTHTHTHKAFDTVHRKVLMKCMQKVGCTPKFISLLHENNTGTMSLQDRKCTVVKQGHVLAPTLFSMYMTFAHTLALKKMSSRNIIMNSRYDGGFFNL